MIVAIQLGVQYGVTWAVGGGDASHGGECVETHQCKGHDLDNHFVWQDGKGGPPRMTQTLSLSVQTTLSISPRCSFFDEVSHVIPSIAFFRQSNSPSVKNVLMA